MKRLISAATVTALLFLTNTGFAQLSVVSSDPNPKTDGCQNSTAAVHRNGDVVSVDRFGQWRSHNGQPIQNGGANYSSCETESLVRTDIRGQLVWQLTPDNTQDAGFSRQDRIVDIAAMDDGRTVLVVSQRLDEDISNTIVMLDPEGDLLWRVSTAQFPKFTTGTTTVHKGALFVTFYMTNYAYPGGKFQLPDGRVHALRASERRFVMVRLDPASGKLLWEKTGFDLVDASNGELLAVIGSFKKGNMRYRILRMDFDGKTLGKAYTPWLKHESSLSMIRWRDQLVMTTEVEDVKDQRVQQRYAKLRAFTLDGKPTHQRVLSDGAVLSDPMKGDGFFVVAPTNCVRGIQKYACVTDAVDVLELKSPEAVGVASRIELPNLRLKNNGIWATNIGRQLWFGGQSFEGAKGAPGAGTIVTYTQPDDRPQATATKFVWNPVPQSKARSAPLVSF